MTTATLHSNVQRSRFAQHALAAFSGLAGALFGVAARPAPGSRADEIAREAQHVRELASSYLKTDPGFAADLYAAAARHEGVHAE
jgi:hypothetical protein